MLNAHASMTRTARRKILVDRFTELLTDWGSPHADDRALQLLAAVDDAGFTLPPALDDPPPLRPDRMADPDHRAACKAEIDDILADRRARRPAFGGSA